MSDRPMEGKVAIVTGGAMGIGRYVASTFARAGAKVVIADVAEMDAVTADLRSIGAEFLTIRTDVRVEVQVQAMVTETVSRFDRVDVLVNNAAIATHFEWGNPRWQKVRDMEKTFWDTIIDTNLGGTFLCCKHVVPHMESLRAGHIINFGQSSSGERIGACVYGVSKAAIQMFSRFLAEEEREYNICVLSLTPGVVIAGAEAPEAARQRLPGPEVMGDCLVQAAQLDLAQSGQQFTAEGGKLRVVA